MAREAQDKRRRYKTVRRGVEKGRKPKMVAGQEFFVQRKIIVYRTKRRV